MPNKKALITQNKYNFLFNNLNEQELNSLDYQKAVIIDKRTYIQYYLSLIKKKHLIIFTFYPTLDYNLRTIKICLFLVSFSLYIVINAFFFSDKTMHNLYYNNGGYDIISQMTKILLSSLISIVINIILKMLCLSEKQFIEYKQMKDMNNNSEKKIIQNLKIKYFIFFIISYILLFFFWYFISCFCAVYINTQIILLKDTFISFGLSMLYPFVINLIPGLFRIPALRASKRDKQLIYRISLYFSYI